MTESTTRPLKILMSRPAAEQLGDRLAAAMDGRPWRLVHLEDEPAQGDTFDIDVAFLSREVTGKSGKTDLSPGLTRYYAMLRASPGLKWLQAHSAGMDKPIYAELHARGVTVTTASGTTAKGVAQMALAGLLAIARRLPALIDSQRRKAWEPLYAKGLRDVSDLSVLVVGLGPIGEEVARVCQAIGMRVSGMSRTARGAPAGFSSMHTYGEIEAVLPKMDAIVLACPLTGLTRGLLDARRLRSMPAGALVVNVARGEVIVEADLAEVLAEGHLGGAFLDVFHREPLSVESPFWTLPNVVVSPHTAAHTTGLSSAVAALFLDNLARWNSGRPLRNVASFASG